MKDNTWYQKFHLDVLYVYRDCLHDHILKCRDADVKCPCYVNDEVVCKGSITEAEMRSVCKYIHLD